MPSGKSALKIVQKYHPGITRVIDARKPISITVTAEDCKGSKRRKPNACAMAKACERKFDGAIISLAVAYLVKGTKAIRYRVPQAISRELVSFDRHHDFAPGKYKLNAPTEHERLGHRRSPQPENRNDAKYKQRDTKNRTHRTVGIRSL